MGFMSNLTTNNTALTAIATQKMAKQAKSTDEQVLDLLREQNEHLRVIAQAVDYLARKAAE